MLKNLTGTLQTSECVDATLEEVWHLVTSEGFSRTWEAELGERDSLMSQAMDIARGGHFENVPSQYPENAWYTYYPPRARTDKFFFFEKFLLVFFSIYLKSI